LVNNSGITRLEDEKFALQAPTSAPRQFGNLSTGHHIGTHVHVFHAVLTVAFDGLVAVRGASKPCLKMARNLDEMTSQWMAAVTIVLNDENFHAAN
jgi:hypothetical protein